MNPSAEFHHVIVGGGTARAQLITLAVDTLRGRGDADLVRPALGAVQGVEAVEPDPTGGRVWVFADGAVEPEALVDALAAWGYGAYVLENQFELPA